jgi:hypothetical protein
MGFDDFVKDLFDDIDWGDVVGSILGWILKNQNIYQIGVEAIISLIRVALSLRGMTEEQAKASFMAKIGELKDLPDLQMSFDID